MLRAFSALPTERRVREMKDRDLLWCAVNLMLDDEQQLQQLCPQCRQRALEERCTACGAPLGLGEGAVNGGFDAARFEQLRKGAGR